MDLLRVLGFLSFFAVNLIVVDASYNTTEIPQYGRMSCILVGNILQVQISVLSNGSTTIVGTEFAGTNDWSLRYRTGDCVFTGNGSDSNPFQANLEIDTNTDQPPASKTFCGHAQVGLAGATATNYANPKLYRFTVHTYGELDLYNYGDLIIVFTCATVDVPTYLTITYKLLPPPPTQNLTQNNGVIRLDVISPTTDAVVTTVQIGQPIRVQIEFTPSAYVADGHSEDLRPWGVYCDTLYATPFLGSDRKVQLLDANGCPDTTAVLQPETSFVNTNAANKYIARTGNMTSVRFSATPTEGIALDSGDIVFVCLARFCVKPYNTLCTDRCSTNGRRKRQTEAEVLEERTTTLYAVVNVYDYLPQPKNEEVTKETFPLAAIIALAVSGGLILVSGCVLVLFLCKRRTRNPTPDYYKHSNPSSVASTVSQKTKSSTVSGISRSKKDFDRY